MTFSMPTISGELRTARLWLRPPRVEDAEALQAAIEASLPELKRWMPWAHQPSTLAQRREYVAASLARFQEGTELTYLIWASDGETLLGNSSLHHLNWLVPKGEMGYWVATPHTGQGYAQEAAQALTSMALDTLGLRRLEIRCDARNERSARIPRQLGYVQDALFRNDAVAADNPLQLRDTLVFSRVQ
ncbi:N-acetyltransferase [Deinococcus cavernae]|uniref:N-acetyltransferase n=1 Tax=Deinococcus cavernae TaxID=2320857 RepID=A0A418V8W7_9DEIO|nr:GNAT family N-acetyltransferase [Deinococcus cavernae]RJF72533.1 N-acetyltransferase [Deinococcus cavernae]